MRVKWWFCTLIQSKIIEKISPNDMIGIMAKAQMNALLPSRVGPSQWGTVPARALEKVTDCCRGSESPLGAGCSEPLVIGSTTAPPKLAVGAVGGWLGQPPPLVRGPPPPRCSLVKYLLFVSVQQRPMELFFLVKHLQHHQTSAPSIFYFQWFGSELTLIYPDWFELGGLNHSGPRSPPPERLRGIILLSRN